MMKMSLMEGQKIGVLPHVNTYALYRPKHCDILLKLYIFALQQHFLRQIVIMIITIILIIVSRLWQSCGLLKLQYLVSLIEMHRLSWNLKKRNMKKNRRISQDAHF